MNVVAPSGAKIYNLTAGKTLPLWIPKSKRKELRNDLEFQQRIQLLQDFEFKGACQQVQVSKDGYYVAAVGTYPPRFKLYSVEDLSMKVERGLDSEVVKFSFLSDDYKKLIFLENDRNIELHAQWGAYYKLRIPKFGRDMIYDQSSAEAYVASSGPEVYRLNLSSGKFEEPWKTNSTEGNNAIAQNSEHLLVAVGGENGHVECFDPRQGSRVGDLNLRKHIGDNHVSALSFDPENHMNLAIGTSSGVVMLYDIRSSNPLLVRDHQYDLPIVNVQFQGDYCISTDNRICKVWEKSSGKPFANIESDVTINSSCCVSNSGLMFVPKQQDKIEIYYIPGLGCAPFWCSFLDNLTEELEDTQTVIYDDYKFVTRAELDQLGLSKLVGTPYLRAYMHGFWMDARLYRKVLDIANPYGYKEYVQDRIKRKREEQQQSRITKSNRGPKVNKFFHERYLQDLKADDRFSAIMNNPEFQIDPNHEEYQKKNPPVKTGFTPLVPVDDDEPEPEERPRKSSKKSKNPSKASNPSALGKRNPETEKRELTSKMSLAARVKLSDSDISFKNTSKTPSKNIEITFTPPPVKKRKIGKK